MLLTITMMLFFLFLFFVDGDKSLSEFVGKSN